jgi:hypothetical protein
VAASTRLLPHLRAAALGALGAFCDPATRKVVHAAQSSTSRLVTSAAARTIRRCNW